jgi:hypothetical protein|nr:MAG TPA: transposase [Caudoviricetes sp.]
MAGLKDDILCKYCLGCNKLENHNFIGTRNCKGFIPGYKNWRELYEKALQNNLKNEKN